jgi:FkbM family methyltransferase
VIAVEPHEDNFTFLQANVRAFPNILPVRAALSSTAGTLFLTDPTGGAASDAYRARATATGVASRVDAVTLPDLLERAPDTTPFICKLDIEGAEQDLFSKPSPLMAGFPLVIAELHDWMFPGQATSRNLLRWHVDQDRDLVTLGENVFSIARSISEPVAERVEVASAG